MASCTRCRSSKKKSLVCVGTIVKVVEQGNVVLTGKVVEVTKHNVRIDFLLPEGMVGQTVRWFPRERVFPVAFAPATAGGLEDEMD